MKLKTKKYTDLSGHEEECRALANFIEEFWEGTGKLKPKGYAKLAENYTDFDGMYEWEENEKQAQEEKFNAYDDATAGSFNFVGKVSLPHVVYDDIDQGRNPLMTLIGACVSYGFMRGELYGKHEAFPDKEIIISMVEAVLKIIKA